MARRSSSGRPHELDVIVMNKVGLPESFHDLPQDFEPRLLGALEHVRGSGDPVSAIATICMDLDAPPRDGWDRFQKLRDQFAKFRRSTG